jgi:CRISPR-associated exonuclease Cas4
MCLEEMTGHAVPKGAIYHYSSRRRREVDITPALRAEVEQIIPHIRALLARGKIPPPVQDDRCRHCSLQDACQPQVVAAQARWQRLYTELFLPEEDA